MRLSLQTDFAMRTLLYVATASGRSTVGEISAFFQISAHHLGKVVHRLGRLGFVTNVRGPQGGVALARPAREITIGEVVRGFEPTLHLLECVGTDGVCVIQPGCKLRRALAEAERLMIEHLDGVTLESLLPPRGDLTYFLDSPGGLGSLGPA